MAIKEIQNHQLFQMGVETGTGIWKAEAANGEFLSPPQTLTLRE